MPCKFDYLFDKLFGYLACYKQMLQRNKMAVLIEPVNHHHDAVPLGFRQPLNEIH